MRAFEEKCGLGRGNISNMSQEGTLGSDKLTKIIDTFPGIDLYWLLTGKDDPVGFLNYQGFDDTPNSNDPQLLNKLIRQAEEIGQLKKQIEKGFAHEAMHEAIPFAEAARNGLNPIPLVTQTAAAGFGNENFSIEESDVKEYYVIPKFKYSKVDFMIEVSGLSMYPHFNSGDVIACSILRNTQFIQWNKCHVIATREQGILVKRLMPGDDMQHLRAVSDNKEYPPFDIPVDEITGIALVVGSVSLE